MKTYHSENDLAFQVIQIAKRNPNMTATFDDCWQKIPTMIKLTHDDRKISTTRPNEEMWQQRVRNIQSHHDRSSNYINAGYLISVPDKGYMVTPLGVGLTIQPF